MKRVEGKVALVTGGASGIGRQSAIRLAGEGAKVVVGDLDRVGGEATVATIGGGAMFVEHDVTDEAGWRAVVDRAVERFGRLDILVNCAGIALLRSIEDTSLDEWRRVHAVNLDGVFLGCKFAVAAMKRSGGGSIINLSSVSGLVGGHNLAAYNSSKGGVRLLTKSVALHCARQGYNIRCNSVHPTFIATPMVQAMIDAAADPERARQNIARQVPLGRIGEPDDVAWVVVYLASDESRFVTGAEFVIDGGVTAM